MNEDFVQRPYILEIPCNATPRIAQLDELTSFEINNIFPNPVIDEVFVKLEVQKAMEVRMTVLNLVGKTMDTKILDLENYSNGIYQLNFSSQDQSISKKVVKMD